MTQRRSIDTLRKILFSPNKTIIRKLGEAVGDTPEPFAAFVRAEIPKWVKVVGDSGAKVD